MEEFTIKATLTQKDLEYFFYNRTVKNPLYIILFFCGLYNLLFGIITIFNKELYTSPDNTNPFLFSGGLFMVFILLFLYFVKWRARKFYKSHIKLQREIIYTFTDDALTYIGYNVMAKYKWSELPKLKITKSMIIIYVANLEALLIPEKLLTDNQTAFLKSKIKSK